MTTTNIKKIIFSCTAILLVPFHFSSALAVYESFTPEISLNDECIVVVSYSTVINTQTITDGNSFVLALNKLDDQGVSVQSLDFPISIPGNGTVNNATFIATGFAGLATYKVKIVENGPNANFIGQSQVVQLMPSAGTCVPLGGNPGVDTNSNGVFSSLEQMEVPIENPININSIPNLIKKVLEAMIKIGIPLLVIMLVYSGALYLFARGNETKIGEAHDMFLYTLVGGAILLGAWALSELIYDTLIDLTAFVLQTFV